MVFEFVVLKSVLLRNRIAEKKITEAGDCDSADMSI